MRAEAGNAYKKWLCRSARSLGVLSPAERKPDGKAFGKEIRKSKDSARALVQRADIPDTQGQPTAPYGAQ